MEQQIKLAAKLYKCRDSAKSLYGEKYKEKMQEYIKYIFAAMLKFEEPDNLKAAIKLAEEYKDNGIIVMNIMAAVVELIEQSNAT